MKTIIGILLWLLASAQGFSQAKADPMHQWSFGISAGDILHQLFNTDSAPRSYSAFVLEYTGPRYAFQAGFRPGYNKSNTRHADFVDSEVSRKTSVSGDLQLTRNIFKENRWQIKAGLKWVAGWSKEDIIKDSGFDRVTTRRLAWNSGIGPVIDIRLRVHPRISFGTEASLIYSWSRSELQQLFENFPDFNNSKDIVNDQEVAVHEPATIYLRYHF